MADAIRIPVRRKLLYVGVMVVIPLALGEGGLRLRAWMQYGTTVSVRDPMLTYDAAARLRVPMPGFELKGSKIDIKINSLGFRGDEFSRVKPPGTFRIVCLGASTTFSSEASSNDTIWTHRLQVKLQEAYPAVHIEVINAAVSGYVATESLRNLRYRVLPLDPDLVIFYELNNQIVHDTQELATRQGLVDPGWDHQTGLAATLSKYSLLFDLIQKNMSIWSSSRSDSGPKIDRVPADLPDQFISVLDEMKSDLAARQVPLMLSTFIVKYRRDQDRATQVANADVAFYYMPWMSIEGLQDAMDVYNAAILKYARQAGLLVVDDRNVIPPDADHFVDCMHFTDHGDEVMAERFFRFLAASHVVGPPREHLAR